MIEIDELDEEDESILDKIWNELAGDPDLDVGEQHGNRPDPSAGGRFTGSDQISVKNEGTSEDSKKAHANAKAALEKLPEATRNYMQKTGWRVVVTDATLVVKGATGLTAMTGATAQVNYTTRVMTLNSRYPDAGIDQTIDHEAAHVDILAGLESGAADPELTSLFNAFEKVARATEEDFLPSKYAAEFKVRKVGSTPTPLSNGKVPALRFSRFANEVFAEMARYYSDREPKYDREKPIYNAYKALRDAIHAKAAK